MKTKICTKCKKQRTIDNFYKMSAARDGLRPSCKNCSIKQNKEYYHKNIDKKHQYEKMRYSRDRKKRLNLSKEYYRKNRGKIVKQRKKYYKNNKKEILKKDKQYRIKNREKISQREKRYYQNNREEICGIRREYRRKNKDEINKQRKIYCKKNKEKFVEYGRRYYKKHKDEIKIRTRNYRLKSKEKVKEKYRTNINYKIARLMRNRIYAVLIGKTKSKSTIELLGCNIEELKIHLQKQFQPGMSFENYGEWHIDHIKPCNIFDLTKPKEQQKCFHYSNLRPLWGRENFSRPKDGSDLK